MSHTSQVNAASAAVKDEDSVTWTLSHRSGRRVRPLGQLRVTHTTSSGVGGTVVFAAGLHSELTACSFDIDRGTLALHGALPDTARSAGTHLLLRALRPLGGPLALLRAEPFVPIVDARWPVRVRGAAINLRVGPDRVVIQEHGGHVLMTVAGRTWPDAQITGRPFLEISTLYLLHLAAEAALGGSVRSDLWPALQVTRIHQDTFTARAHAGSA